MSWTAGEDRYMAEWRDEYARPKGKHRAQAPKPAQAGPSLPKGETTITEECGVEGQHSECRRITVDGYECGCACHDDEEGA